MRFPETADSISGDKINLLLTKLDNQNYRIASEPPYTGASKPYNGLRYTNPFRFWFPFPLIRTSEDTLLRIDGGGILSLMQDPIDMNSIYFLAYADVRYKMAMIDQFQWQNTGMGFPLTLTLSDKVIESENDAFRYTQAALSGSINWTGDQWNNQVSMGGGYYRTAGLQDGKSAYEWGETETGFFMHTGFFFSRRRLSLQFSGASPINSFAPRLDMIFRANTKTRFPVSLALFGAYDEKGMDLHGVSSIFGETIIDGFVLKEYPKHSGLELSWLGGGEIAVGLFSFNIQKNLSHLYYNRFYGSLSVRNQIYDSGGHPDAEGIQINNLHLVQSLGLKIGMKISFFPVVKTPLSVEPFVSGKWLFSNAITGKGYLWSVSLGVTGLF